jgi:hypothetical protein
MSFDPACKRKLGTAGTAQLGVRITTVNTQKNKEQRSFVVSGAQVWVKPFPAGLYSPASTLTGPRGFACLTLKPSKHRDSAVSTLVLFVRAMDPKRKDEVSVRRLMRVRLGIDAIGSGGGSSNPTK